MLEIPSEKLKIWNQLITEWRASGLTNSEFCRQNGIDRKLFYKWRKRLAPETVNPPTRPYGTMSPATSSRLELVELKTPQGGRLFGSGVSLSCNGVHISLDSGFDECVLRSALSVIGGQSC